uniref:Protein kinase domain-containing protein n=2 Tax=Aegilops tauschii subsp. strangulata TaxID=200361 RepID=A0A453C9Z6_AEGTS
EVVGERQEPVRRRRQPRLPVLRREEGPRGSLLLPHGAREAETIARRRSGGGGGAGRHRGAGGGAPGGERANRLLRQGEADRGGVVRQGVQGDAAEREARRGEEAGEDVQARLQRRLPPAAGRGVQAAARELRPPARLHHKRRPPRARLRVRHHGHPPRRPARYARTTWPREGVGAREEVEERPVLSWAHRVQIALDAARGLEYLHEKASPPVVHKDVRSTNVLLFDGMRAKIADYNMFSQAADMARLNRSTHTLGSFGYQAPEYAMSGQMTDKSDVYSFGIVLLELLTGRKPLDRTLPQGQRSLVNWASPLLTEDRAQECIDPRLGDKYPATGALKLGRIAVQCLQYDPTYRPSMGTIARVINYAVVRDQQGVV